MWVKWYFTSNYKSNAYEMRTANQASRLRNCSNSHRQTKNELLKPFQLILVFNLQKYVLFNPRLPKVLFVAHLPKRLVTTPLRYKAQKGKKIVALHMTIQWRFKRDRIGFFFFFFFTKKAKKITFWLKFQYFGSKRAKLIKKVRKRSQDTCI